MRWRAGDGSVSAGKDVWQVDQVVAAGSNLIGQANYDVSMDIDRDGDVDSTDSSLVNAVGTLAALPTGWISAVGSGGSGESTLGYCGYLFNRATQQYAVRFRVYDPNLGRWIQRDPIGYADSMGLYGYGSASPSMSTDPSGLVPIHPGHIYIGRQVFGWLYEQAVADPIEAVHLGLDVAGLVPVVGEVFDLANATMYLVEGRHEEAALSLAAMIPILGSAATAVKLGGKAIILAKGTKYALAGAGAAPTAGKWILTAYGWVATMLPPGAAFWAQKNVLQHKALRDLVNEVTHDGHKALNAEDADTIMRWAREYDYPGFRVSPDDLGGGHWRGGPHFHLPGCGRGGHVPVEPGVTPP